MDGLLAAGLSVALMLSAAAGSWVRYRLDDRHFSRESIDSVRLLMGMLLTFAALVLGLLTSNAKQRFDGLGDDLSAFGAGLIELNRGLAAYGPEAADIGTLLRRYTAAAIADSWPSEPLPAGDYPRFGAAQDPAGIERVELGTMLTEVERRIDQLAPPDVYRQHLAGQLRERAVSVIAQRWTLIFAAGSTIAWPFLLVLTSWLSIIFALFGLTAPPSRLVRTVAVLAALSIASPLYLILEYGDALTGTIALSSAPLRTALAHMDSGDAAPQIPPGR